MPTTDFVDQDGVPLEEGQLIIRSYLQGRSASLGKAIITGFTPQRVRIASFYWQRYYVMEAVPPNKYGYSYKRYVLDDQGKRIKDPSRPSELKMSEKTIKPGPNVLIWPGDEWETIREARRQGLLDTP